MINYKVTEEYLYPNVTKELRFWIAKKYRTTPERVIIDKTRIRISIKPLDEFTFFNPRDLSDYFDSVGIYGNVTVLDFGIRGIRFGWQIRQFVESLLSNEESIPSRTEAETALFTKCFSIREEQLTAKENRV